MARVWTHCDVTGRKLTEEEIKRREWTDDFLIKRGVVLEDGPVKTGTPRTEPMTEKEIAEREEFRKIIKELIEIGTEYARNPE